MNKPEDTNFALYLTRGISLFVWDEIGTLEREIKPYQKLAGYFKHIYLFTYGVNEAIKYSKLFPANVQIISKPIFVPVIIYSFLLPFIHYKLLKEINIIKTNQMNGSWAAVITKKIFGTKLVIRCGYEWLQYLEKINSSVFKMKIAYWIERLAYNNADKILITSEEGKVFIKNRFKINELNINLIPNYIDTKRFDNLNLPKERGRIIFVGRLDVVKNLGNLIRGMKGLDAYLVIVGNGRLKKHLELLAKKEGIMVEFKGNIPQQKMPEEFNKSEIFVLPSISEGNPKVLLEAMSCGLACLGSNIPSIKEIITDGVNGILCQTDPESIHSALFKLLDDQTLRKEMGGKARQTIMERFSFENILDMELGVYSNL